MIEKVHKLISHSTSPTEGVIQLLENTYIGTKGNRYQLLDTRQKINDLVNPHFISIERNQKIIGTVTICERNVQLHDSRINALYIRYFAFDALFQSSGTGIRQENIQQKNQSGFHAYFNALFGTSNMNPADPVRNSTFYWAYIDPENFRSSNMNKQFGFESIGSFKTISFSRIDPKSSNSVERIKEADKKTVLEELNHFYKDFALYSTAHLFDHDNFFVFKKDGEIVAGIQANPVHFEIKELSGIKGKVLLKSIPFIPGIRKIMHPKDFRFLATEGIFWKAGFEHIISELLEGILALTGYHSMLLWEDNNSNHISSLEIKWGIIQKMKKDNFVDIIGRFVEMNQASIDKLRQSKKYLSGFDMT